VGSGSLWISLATGTLLRLDPRTGEEQASIELERSLTFLSVGDDAVWVMNQLGNVFRVDPETDAVVATIPVSSSILGGDIVATRDAIWVQATRYSGVEVDPATNEVVQQVRPGQGNGSIAVTGDGAVWITAHDVSTLYRIPPD
jgi:virginiamycin B lyase